MPELKDIRFKAVEIATLLGVWAFAVFVMTISGLLLHWMYIQAFTFPLCFLEQTEPCPILPLMIKEIVMSVGALMVIQIDTWIFIWLAKYAKNKFPQSF